MTDDARPRCGNCRFWEYREDVTDAVGVRHGDCRRHAPVRPGPHGGDRFPLVSWREWCGEHRPAGQAPGQE